MTKEQAFKKGLVFTGKYGRDKEQIKNEVDELVMRGYKAYCITVPDSPYSRGEISQGWSVYAEKRYMDDLQAENYRNLINNHPNVISSIKADYEKKLAQVEEQNNGRLEWLRSNGY